MKRILLLFSALMLSCIALWAHDVEIGGIYYNLDKTNKTAGVTYRGDDYDYYDDEYTGSVTIPETITYNSEIYSVTSIGQYAFEGCRYLTSVTIPNSVTSIGQYAFDECSGLTKVNYLGTVDKWVKIDFEGYDASNPTTYAKDLYINNELLTDVKITTADSIKNYAFYNCQSIKSVEIGNSVTSIGYNAFSFCSGLKKVNYLGTVDKWVEIDFDINGSNPTTYAKDLYINNELLTDVKITTANSIKFRAFYNCQSIKSVEIGNSVTSIGDYAFYNCSGLTSVTIPNSVTSIGYYAFYNCSGLTSVTIPNSVTSIGYYAFYDTGIYNNNPNWDNGVLYIDNCLIEAKSDVVKGSYTIKEGTRIIGSSAFSDCGGLTSVTIPNSVTSIGSDAFYNCSGLTSVTIGNSVTSIGSSAFSRCSGLTEVTIPNSVTSIGSSAFYNCSGLTSVTIPNSVTSIGYEAFSGCSGLTSVTIPNSVTYIGSSAFSGCSGLTSVIWNAKNYKSDSPFYYIRSNITSFTFGNEVEHIPADLCYGMSKLTEITIPNSVTSIGDYAFRGCSGLTSVTIPNSVTSIGDYAFYNCSGLTSVTIPNSVTSIGSSAFYECSGLTSVIWNAKNCKDFSSYSSSPFYNIRSNITSFTFGNVVEHIPAYLCYRMSKLTEITIPNSVTTIGDEAFYNCSGLTKVNYLGNIDIWVEIDFKDSNSNPTRYAKDLYINNELLTDVKITTADSIKKYAFYNCQSIKSVEIGESVTSIGSSAFYNCSGLTSVIWNAKNCKDFSSYSSSPFYNIRSNITSFTFGNVVEHIPAYLCYRMSKLTEITIPNSVTTIGDEAFYNCSGLTKVNYLGNIDIWVEIDFKDSNSNPTRYAKDLYINNELLTDVKITTADSIKKYAFYNCQSIKSVEIGNSVKSIGNDAFYNCSGLIKVNYLGTVDKWVEFDWDYSNSNPTYYAKDLYINNELLTDVKITTADSIKNYAFYNCQSIKSVEIGESITSIGEDAFYGCDKLRKVTAYPTTVPNVYESSFAHYNAALYVPCDVYDDYFFDDVFGTFKVTECIAAEEVDAPEKVEIEVDEDNNANVIWPSTDGAKKYELEISKDGEVFCTLLFNENGQLTSIDFGNRSASVGFQFTVTGLDGASKYAYSMVAMDKKGNELQSYKGTFTTNGYVPGPGEEDEPTSITETLADANITVSGGTISADADFSIYNTIGQNVTAQNGSLQPGIYVLALGEDRVKIMIK